MKRSLALFAAAFALALTATTQSQADPYFFTYNWTATTSLSGSIPAGGGGVTLSSYTGPLSAPAETDTPATNITTFSAVHEPVHDVIAGPTNATSGFAGSNYQLTLTLTDNQLDASNQPTNTATVTFSGLLSGYITHETSVLNNAITGVTDGSGFHAGQTDDTVTLSDGTQYLVSYSGFSNPGPVGSTLQGGISFHISPNGSVVGNPSPEPSSMVLGCLGLVVVGGVVVRARRRNAEMLKAAV